MATLRNLERIDKARILNKNIQLYFTDLQHLGQYDHTYLWPRNKR